MVSIRDVAKVAGVSHQTVSNVLNTPEIVSEATRERINKAIKLLGYKPNAAARRLRSGHSDVIALGIAPGSDHAPSPIFDSFMHQLAAAAGNDGKKVMLYAKTDQEHDIALFESLQEQSDVDAIVLSGLEDQDARPKWLLEHQQLFALFGRPWNIELDQAGQIPWVDVDGFSGMKEITKRLIEAGRTHIGYVGWEPSTGVATDRYDGWKAALDEAHFDYAANPYELETWTESVEEELGAGLDATATLYERHPDLDAIVCPSDNIAVGALLASSRLTKYAVVDDARNSTIADRPIIVTGFDNSRLARSFAFPSVSQPLDQVADELVRMIREILKGVKVTNEPRWHRLFKPSVVWRDVATHE
ncbi:MAG: LacI family transcriptional regulator [Bifidobacteriaceae bacterium]|jgi:DNA-binding LacI/PurR family transcriptional regulator|nr:LacI family transcriptional regulator [Bifidobacteriaceae bacterium]MCI1915452.1 LacI family transcriptional regulator [Bifidobacteriaceae bacterium]